MSRRVYANRPGSSGRRTIARRRAADAVRVVAFSLLLAGPAAAQPPISPQPRPIALPQLPGNGDPQKPDPVLPPPKPYDPPPLGMQQLPKACPDEGVLGRTPRPGAKTAEKYDKYFTGLVDPEATLDLIRGRTRLLMLKETPKRIAIGDDAIAEYNLISKDQIMLMGRSVGVTVMTLWFADPKDASKEDILTYHVRVLPDPSEKEQLERTYKALQDQINCAFPNSVICLHLVGDKLVVTGQAHDIAEASQILKIIRANAQSPMGGGHSSTGRIPTDRVRANRDPNNPVEPAGQALTPGVDDYLIEGAGWIVNMIRIPGEQTVNLKVTIAEVNRTAARSIGLNFTLLNNNGVPYFNNSTGSILTGGQTFGIGGFGGFGFSAALAGNTNFIPGIPGVTVGSGGYGNLLASLDNGQVRLAISALKNLQYARLMAEPNLATINGQTANFRAGGQFPVPVIANSGFQAFGLQGVQYRPYGIDLNFTPYITDRDRIRLVLNADVTGLDVSAGTTNIGGANIPSLNQRAVNTTVEMREGQTLAVAGLIQNNISGDSKRLPFIGDLPFLGNLTGFNRVTSGEQELVILVTPELVHPLDCKDKLPLPGHDLFEPTDFEFYILGRIESHRPFDNRTQAMTDWQRIKNYRSMESTYIAGPSGYCEK